MAYIMLADLAALDGPVAPEEKRAYFDHMAVKYARDVNTAAEAQLAAVLAAIESTVTELRAFQQWPASGLFGGYRSTLDIGQSLLASKSVASQRLRAALATGEPLSQETVEPEPGIITRMVESVKSTVSSAATAVSDSLTSPSPTAGSPSASSAPVTTKTFSFGYTPSTSPSTSSGLDAGTSALKASSAAFAQSNATAAPQAALDSWRADQAAKSQAAVAAHSAQLAAEARRQQLADSSMKTKVVVLLVGTGVASVLGVVAYRVLRR